MRVSLLESIQCAGYTETQDVGGDGACQELTVPINVQGDFPRKFLWHLWLSVAGHRPLTLYVMPLPWKTVAPLLLSPMVRWHNYCPLPRSNLQKEQDGAFSYPGHSLIFWCHQLTSPEKVTPAMQYHLSSTVFSKRDGSDLNLKLSVIFISLRIQLKLMGILLQLEGK